MKLLIHIFFSVVVKIYYSKVAESIRQRKLSKISDKVEADRQRINKELSEKLQENKEKCWEQYFAERGMQTLAVYGAGAVGKELAGQLKRRGCCVQYFVDKFNMESEIAGIPVLQFRRDYLQEVDAVIITPCHEYDFIVYQLQNYYGRSVKLLSLDKLLGGAVRYETYFCVRRLSEIRRYFTRPSRSCAAMS